VHEVVRVASVEPGLQTLLELCEQSVTFLSLAFARNTHQLRDRAIAYEPVSAATLLREQLLRLRIVANQDAVPLALLAASSRRPVADPG